jgi:hypothetical protein
MRNGKGLKITAIVGIQAIAVMAVVMETKTAHRTGIIIPVRP